eukprot:TRINITY_DN80892_c0_g1_i1.p1 TRINITY_DN80892_c0_g1~~TRINITY_DN80892_c0_g1_i1.p1  ORF type:complete len:821 (-),score=147.59 TRINITY_DN80892_c0_g1_i1:80-2542(-)
MGNVIDTEHQPMVIMATEPPPLWVSPPEGPPERTVPELETEKIVLPPTPRQAEDDIATKIRKALRHGSSLKYEVATLFNFIVGDDEKAGLTEEGLRLFAGAFTRTWGLPQEALGDIHDDYIRFDFDGDAMIEEHECYKLVKYCLRQYLKEIDPHGSELVVPWSSMEAKGYRAVRELGRGGQGLAELCVDKTGQQFCVKIVTKGDICENHIEELREEFAVMRELSNSHLARTFELFQDPNYLYFVNEPYFGGDLTTLQARAQSQGIRTTEAWWRGVFRQCFQGLAYLHTHALIHCDIKEPNIMLRSEDLRQSAQIVIIDYGLAQSSAGKRAALCGTPGYIPPETWATGKWYPKGDCFALGVTMTQLLTDNVPADDGTPGIFQSGAETLDQIRDFTCQRTPPLHLLPEQMVDLQRFLMALMHKDPELRPAAPQALHDPWFRMVEFHDEGEREQQPNSSRPSFTMDTSPIELTPEGPEVSSLRAVSREELEPVRYQSLVKGSRSQSGSFAGSPRTLDSPRKTQAVVLTTSDIVAMPAALERTNSAANLPSKSAWQWPSMVSTAADLSPASRQVSPTSLVNMRGPLLSQRSNSPPHSPQSLPPLPIRPAQPMHSLPAGAATARSLTTERTMSPRELHRATIATTPAGVVTGSIVSSAPTLAVTAQPATSAYQNGMYRSGTRSRSSSFSFRDSQPVQAHVLTKSYSTSVVQSQPAVVYSQGPMVVQSARSISPVRSGSFSPAARSLSPVRQVAASMRPAHPLSPASQKQLYMSVPVVPATAVAQARTPAFAALSAPASPTSAMSVSMSPAYAFSPPTMTQSILVR